MKYDPHNIRLADTPQLLQKRHPDLTPEEHHDRILTAVHEATHMVTAIRLSTGTVGFAAYIRVPRRSVFGYEDIVGEVDCSADHWEMVILFFAGIAAAFISNDPRIRTGCAGDFRYGMQDLRKLAGTSDEKTIRDIRYELYGKTFQIAVDEREIIDLTATAMLLYAREDGILDDQQFQRVEALAREAMRAPGFQRDIFFPIPSMVTDYLETTRSRPSHIAQLKPPYGYYGYPYQQNQPTFNLRGPARGNYTS